MGSLLLTPVSWLWLLFAAATLVVKVFALVDAAVRPQWKWTAAVSKTKQFWLLILGLALVSTLVPFLSLVGLVAAIVYLVDVRPKLRLVGERRW